MFGDCQLNKILPNLRVKGVQNSVAQEGIILPALSWGYLGMVRDIFGDYNQSDVTLIRWVMVYNTQNSPQQSSSIQATMSAVAGIRKVIQQGKLFDDIQRC